MPNTPNYNETTIAGQSWQRSHHVTIQNPLNGIPSITFGEEKVYQMDGKVIKEFVGTQLNTSFDQTRADHVQIYGLLNDLYIELRNLRDSTIPAEPTEIV